MTAIHTVWANASDVPEMVSKCQSFTDLVQILREFGMCQAIFNPNTWGPDNECLTPGMWDLILQHAPQPPLGR